MSILHTEQALGEPHSFIYFGDLVVLTLGSTLHIDNHNRLNKDSSSSERR